MVPLFHFPEDDKVFSSSDEYAIIPSKKKSFYLKHGSPDHSKVFSYIQTL
jgi:hypothetical protein